MRGFASKRLIVAAVLCATLGGCASAPAPTPSASPAGGEPTIPSTTSYGRLFQRVRDEGGVASKEVALQAFSLAISPLPGVVLPEGGPPQDYERAEGTFAIEWLEPYLDDLTAEQRQVYDAALTPDPDSPLHTPDESSAFSLAAFDTAAASAEYVSYENMLKEAQSLITGKLHRKLRVGWSLTLQDEQHETEKTLAVTYASTALVPGGFTCHVYVQPWLRDMGERERAATMAHELFHCFQYDLLGGPKKGVAPWLKEGQAEWVGENLKGPSIVGLGWWSTYLHSPLQPLFDRDYDAYGYYMHMEAVGIDPWTRLDAMLLESDDVAAFKKAGTTDATFLDTWTSGLMRDRTLGAAWIENVPWPTVQHGDASPLDVPAIGSAAVGADVLTLVNLKVKSNADITQTEVKGHTRLSVAGVDSVGLDGRWLCTKVGGCACPPGEFYGGPPFEAAGPEFNVAVTGSLDGVAGSLIGHSLVEFCQPEPSPTPASSGTGGSGSRPPCPRGCSGSTGEPHLRTVDNVAYDVQAAGEYVLLRSPDGSVEIQARQEPRGAAIAPDISINSGVAARVNGHRVAVYVGATTGAGLQVNIDGEVTELATPLDLGNGTRVVRYTSGIEVDLSDGTKMYALAIRAAACCMNIIIAPSDVLRADGAGLLGNVAAGVLPVPALPDGTRLPRVETAHDRFTSIYDVLVPAWLVTDTTTLFDYDAGRTTASYVVEGFPAEAETRTVEDLTPVEREAAAATCSAVTDPDLLLNCMFDVTISDLEEWAKLYDITDNFIASGTDVLDLPEPDADALPDGFVELLPDVEWVPAAAIGPDGTLYLSVQETSTDYAILAVDVAAGTIKARLDTAGGGHVAVTSSAVWVGDIDGLGTCSVTSLDPQTLARRATVAVPCNIVPSRFASFDDAIWFVDRTTADADAHGGRLRRIDPQTNEISGDIVVPFVNGTISSSAKALYWRSQAAVSALPEDRALNRLLPGETAFTSFGPIEGDSIFPADQGFWTMPQIGGPAVYRASPGDPGQQLAIDGWLTGADESAVFVSRTSAFDGASELWRYPIDGSPPERLALGVTLQTANGDQTLSYFSSILLFGEGYAATLWVIPGRVDAAQASLVMQATPLP